MICTYSSTMNSIEFYCSDALFPEFIATMYNVNGNNSELKKIIGNSREKEIETFFINLSWYGYLDCAKWLFSVRPDMYVSKYMFQHSCEDGHLDFAKWLLCVNPNINISADDEFVFRCACWSGHLDMTKWLLKIKPEIDISADNDDAFRNSIFNKFLECAKLLVELGVLSRYKCTISKQYVKIILESYPDLIKYVHCDMLPKKFIAIKCNRIKKSIA